MPAEKSSHATERKTIWRLTHELSQANDALTRLGHMVSHDLRGPLANMEALLGMFDKENMGAEGHSDVLNLFHMAFTDFRQQLDDLDKLLKSRHTSGELWEEVDVREEYHQIRQQLLGLLVNTEAEINVNIEINTICSVRLYIQSIFFNLLSNSLKYRHPARPLEVTFEAKKTDGSVVISVEDNGLGIDMKKDRDRLFKPYTRLQKDGEGHGLGLYLVKGQVEALGGWLQVDSAPGEGSKFSVFLPQSSTL